MFKNIFRSRKDAGRGQVGIGTLIVFIALVLVAAIAAGVLINTAGFLQSQAEATGEESTSQVSDAVQVLSASGEATADDEIQFVELRVSLAPGAEELDLTEGTVQWVGNGDAATFQISDGGNTLAEYKDGATTATTVSTNAVIPNPESTQLTGSTDRTTILLLSGSAEGVTHDGTDELTNDLPMNGGNEATVTVTTSSGAETVVSLNAPDIITSGEGVDL